MTAVTKIQSAGRPGFRAAGISGPRGISSSVLQSLSLIALLLMATRLVGQTTLTVAAAADLQPALRQMAAAYEKQSGLRLRLVFGSSGGLTTQIENGAPYDVFLSADTGYPNRLAAENLAVKDSTTVYAAGKLVLWALQNPRLDIRALGWRALAMPEIHSIAIANPKFAPYGKAAVTALSRLSLYDAVQSKLVLGENVAEAAQFVVSGNAQVGILPLSLARTPEMMRLGQYVELPADSYGAIEQAGVVLRKSKNQKAAESFLQYLKSPPAEGILQRWGFALPEGRR